MLLLAPVLVHAQLGGLLKKKAGEVVTGKPASPAPAPAPAPAAKTDPKAPESKTESKAPAANTEAKAPASPLEISESDLTSKAKQVMLELVPHKEQRRHWEGLPYIGRNRGGRGASA